MSFWLLMIRGKCWYAIQCYLINFYILTLVYDLCPLNMATILDLIWQSVILVLVSLNAQLLWQELLICRTNTKYCGSSKIDEFTHSLHLATDFISLLCQLKTYITFLMCHRSVRISVKHNCYVAVRFFFYN